MRVQSLGWKDAPREGKDNPIQHSFLENSMDRGVYGAIKSWTQLKQMNTVAQHRQYDLLWVSPMTQAVKNPPAMQEMQEMATHASILTW